LIERFILYLAISSQEIFFGPVGYNKRIIQEKHIKSLPIGKKFSGWSSKVADCSHSD